MPFHLHRLRHARQYLPAGLHCIVDEALRTTDEVHQFVRLMSAFEYIIKLISASIHGATRESHPGPHYGDLLRQYFFAKDPSLGDWLQSASTIRRHTSEVALLADVVADVWNSRSSSSESGATSDTWKMCRVVQASRAPLTEVTRTRAFTLLKAFEMIVYLRNAFAHGAVTVRFARRFGQPLCDALADVTTILKLSERWQFVVPVGPDPTERNTALVMECGNLNSAEQCEPSRMAIGDRYLQWGRLYLIPRNATPLDSAVILEPLMRYESSHQDFQFFNRFDPDDLTAEYLSYRSGDFDFQTAFEDWTNEFGTHDVAEPVDDVQATETTPTAEWRQPDAGDDVIRRLLKIAKDGRLEKSLRRCRNRFHEELDSMDAARQRSVLLSLSEKSNAISGLHRVLGGVCREFGFFDLALAELTKAVAECPEDLYLKQSLGHALLQHGISEKQSGRESNSTDRIQEGRRLIVKAKAALLESLEQNLTSLSDNHHNVRSFSMLVDAHCRLGEFDEALKCCDKGLLLDPKNTRLLDQFEFLREASGGVNVRRE